MAKKILIKNKLILIDKEDYKKIKKYTWSINTYGYFFNGKNMILLHQLIMGKKEGYIIDHINHNIYDNRKQNLRFVTKLQNNQNRKSKGIYWQNQINKWYSQIRANGKKIHLGVFNTKNEAIIARRKAEKKYFGEFAYNYN